MTTKHSHLQDPSVFITFEYFPFDLQPLASITVCLRGFTASNPLSCNLLLFLAPLMKCRLSFKPFSFHTSLENRLNVP